MSWVAPGSAVGDFDVVLPPRPYPGLRPFEKLEWPVFFGREKVAEEVVGRVVRHQLVVVHGDSGCGKSSLLRAGVLARLEQEHARGGLSWRTCATLPRDAPLQLLAESLAELDGCKGDESRIIEIRRVLNFGADAPRALAGLLRRGETDHICILIDQFEELFAFARRHGPDEARLLIELLVGLLDSPPPGLYVVVTMRSEFLGVCAQFDQFADAVNRVQYLLPRMRHADLVRAIREPASLYGGHIAADLAERLIADAGGGQDELPLIQHGLMVMCGTKISATKSWRLDLADYGDAGGLARMVSEHADAVADPVEARHPGVVEELFRALTDISAEGQAIRRPQTFDHLLAITATDEATLAEVVDPFRAEGASFMTPYGVTPVARDTLVDISHEALIRRWRRLADASEGWLKREFHDGLIWRSLLVQADSFERNPANVLSPATASERERWLAGRNAAWSARYGGGWDRVQRLVRASVLAARAAEEAERTRTKRKILATLTVAVLLAAALVFAASQYRRAAENLGIAHRANAASLWTRLPSTNPERLAPDELNALWDLRLADPDVKRAFRDELSSNPERVLRFGRRPAPILRAMALHWPEAWIDGVRHAIQRATAAEGVQADQIAGLAAAAQALADELSAEQAREMLLALLKVIESTAAVEKPASAPGDQDVAAGGPRGQLSSDNTLGTLAAAAQALTGKLSPQQADTVIEALVASINRTNGQGALAAIASVLQQLTGDISPARADAALTALLAAIDRASTEDAIAPLAAAVRALAPSVSTERTQAAFRERLAADPAMRVSAGQGLAAVLALSGKLTPEQAAAALDPLLGAVAATRDPVQLQALTSALRVAAQRQSGPQAEKWLASLTDAIAKESDPDRLRSLASGVTALQGRITGAVADAAATAVLRALSRTTDVPAVDALASALEVTPGQLQAAQIQSAIVPRLRAFVTDTAQRERAGNEVGTPNSAVTVASLASTIRAVAAKLAPPQAAAALGSIHKGIRLTVDPGELTALAAAGAALPRAMTEAGAAAALESIVPDMHQSVDPDQRRAFTAIVRALVMRAPGPAHSQLTALLDDIARVPFAYELRRMEAALKAVATGLPVEKAQAALLTAMRRTTHPYQLQILALALQDVTREATAQGTRLVIAQQAPETIAAVVAPAFSRTRDPGQRQALAGAMQALARTLRPGQLTTKQAEAALLPLLSDIKQTIGQGSLEFMAAVEALAGNLTDAQANLAVDTVRPVLAWSSDTLGANAAARTLVALLSRQPDTDRVRALVELMKYPTAGGEATDIFLNGLPEAAPRAREKPTGFHANLEWIERTYPDVELEAPPACPHPFAPTQTCPADGAAGKQGG